MENLFQKMLKFDDKKFAEAQKSEERVLKRLGAVKLHEFDNVGEKNGEYFALENIKEGEEIILCGNTVKKSEKPLRIGDKISI